MDHLGHNHHSNPSDKTSWILGMIFLIVKLVEENPVFSETLHLVFSIAGALIIVTLSHYWKKYLVYREENKK
jgi:hypothetical protein